MSLSAQTPHEAQPSPWLTGVSIGVPGYASDLEPNLFTVAVHATRVEPGRLGGDFFIGTMPRILVEGVLPLGGRAGLVWPLELSETLLLAPSGGASMMTALAIDDGGLAELGLNLGAAAFVLDEASTGLRTGITWHRFRNSNGAVWLLEFGYMFR